MDYKYIKYKKKYIEYKNIIGGSDKVKYILPPHNFDIFTIANTNLYHGTFNKVLDKLRTPYFITTDPLQSIGHLLVEFKNIFNNYPIKDVNQNLSLVFNCFPTLYNYTLNENIHLIHMINPSSFKNSFDILFNDAILFKYIFLLEEDKYIDLMNSFIKKIETLNVITKEQPYDNIIKRFIMYYNKWRKYCRNACFAGFGNTPGYLLLSNINYNEYFKEIEIISDDINVDGIYVDKDQNEIIIFNDTKLEFKQKIPVFPYNILYNTDSIQLTFITNYLRYGNDIINKNYEDIEYIINNIIKPYTFFNIKTIDLEYKWNFDFYKTKCNYYNPLKPMKKQVNIYRQQNCINTCKLLSTPNNFDHTDENNICYDHLGDTTNGEQSDFKSAKYSIDKDLYLFYLDSYINKIINTSYNPEILKLLEECFKNPTLDRSLNKIN